MAMNKITADDVGLFWENCDHKNGGTLDHYQAIATKSAIYPGRGTPLGLAYVTLKLNGEAGEFAEHVGKAMRDDDLMGTHRPLYKEDSVPNTLTDERRELLIKEAGDVLWYLAAAAKELGISLSEVAYRNLDKLQQRGERGTLQGSGDNR